MSGPVGRECVRFEPEAKPGGGVRWLARLAPPDREAYRIAVAEVAGPIEHALGPRALANRTRGRGRRGGRGRHAPSTVLEPWRPARRRFSALARSLGARAGAVAVTDVRSFYASVRDDVLARELRNLGAPASDVGRLLSVLERLHEQGVAGLPVGPEPSAILANAVLLRVDDELRRARVVSLRWVDDLLLFARSEPGAGRALEVAGQALASVELRPAPDKTGIVAGGAEFAPWERATKASGPSHGGPHL